MLMKQKIEEAAAIAAMFSPFAPACKLRRRNGDKAGECKTKWRKTPYPYRERRTQEKRGTGCPP